MTDNDVLAAVMLISDQLIKEEKGPHWISSEFRNAIKLVTEIAQLAVERKLTPSPPDRLMEDMTEPELSAHLNRQLKFIKGCQTEDTVGSMLIIFQKDMICQYGATLDPETVPQALRELATRLEKRETVKRDKESNG